MPASIDGYPMCRYARRAATWQSNTRIGHKAFVGDVEHNAAEWRASVAARCLQFVTVFLLTSTDVQFTSSLLIPGKYKDAEEEMT